MIFGGMSLYSYWQLQKLPEMSFSDTLAHTTRNREGALITVGTIQDGEINYTVYGENATVLAPEEYEYEIGSLTKTFTAALVAEDMLEGRLDLDDSIAAYLPLAEKEHYPTLRSLLSHTSGYKSYYFARKMIINFLSLQANDFYGITSYTVRDQIEEVEGLENKTYPFRYSNFGFAALGEVLEEVHQEQFSTLMHAFVREEMGLTQTRIANGVGDLNGYWNWTPTDAYLPAGGLISTISDMLRYSRLHLEDTLPSLSLTQVKLEDIAPSSAIYEKMDIHLDAVGMSWIWDEKHGLYWHNGGTSEFNSYMAFDKERQIAVVVLSNLPPTFRIPATAMGIKLMTELQAADQE